MLLTLDTSTSLPEELLLALSTVWGCGRRGGSITRLAALLGATVLVVALVTRFSRVVIAFILIVISEGDPGNFSGRFIGVVSDAEVVVIDGLFCSWVEKSRDGIMAAEGIERGSPVKEFLFTFKLDVKSESTTVLANSCLVLENGKQLLRLLFFFFSKIVLVRFQ